MNNFFRDWGHEVLYDYQGLESLLRKHGFIEIAQKDVGESNIALFKSLEKHGEIIPPEFNTLETIVVEAQKTCLTPPRPGNCGSAKTYPNCYSTPNLVALDVFRVAVEDGRGQP